jgi:flavin-dependent dehydrogenase
VLGFHAIGDAHTCTNPIYGRGCSLAAVQATLLADALAEHPDDPRARAEAYEGACAREVEPWYRSSVQLDRMGADPKGGFGLGAPSADGDSASDDDRAAAKQAARTMGAVFVAAATDPVLARAMAKVMNLLVMPEHLMTDAAVLERVAEVAADPDRYPLPPREGPSRSQLLAELQPDVAA